MPFGRYPERVKDFRKWASERIDKANINDSVTGASRPRNPQFRRKRRRRKKKKDDG